MSIASLIRRMSDAGAPPEAIALAVEAIEEAQARDAARRATAAERKARQRAKERDSRGTVAGQSQDSPPKKEIPPTPPKEKTTPPPFSEAEASSNGARAQFADFWTLFPNKVGKRDAEKAFATATRRAPLEAIMAGLRRYVAKTDDRPWCNPATFLHQNRWEDQPAAAPPRRATAPPAPAKPRNAGEAARQELIRRGQYPNATSNPPRLVDTSDGNSGFAGTGIARRIALAASGGRGT